MITILVADNKTKAKEMVSQMLAKAGNASIGIVKEDGVIKMAEKDSLKELVSLKDKLIELQDSLYNEKKGTLYKAILETVEKPLIEYVLERTEGNQLKAARILGINRNTIRSKIKQLGINVKKWKAI